MAEAAIDINRTKLAPVEVSSLKEISDPVIKAAHALEIIDQKTLDRAGAFLTEQIKPTLKKIADSCGPVVKAAHAAHKAAKTQQNDLEAPLKEAERIVKQKMGAYLDEQERIAREEAKRIEEEQRRRAEEEQLEQAARLEAEGKTEEADAMLNGPTPEPSLPAPPPPMAPRKVAGVSSQIVWKAEVVDFRALVGDVAAGRAPISIVKIDEGALNRLVQSLGGEAKYAGVRVYQDRTISARAR